MLFLRNIKKMIKARFKFKKFNPKQKKEPARKEQA